MEGGPGSGLFSGRPLTATERLAVAVVVGLGAASGVWIMLGAHPYLWAKDFTYPWWAARALLAGANPWRVAYPFPQPLFYPLTAVLAAVPFAPLAPRAAAAAFTGLSFGALAWALARTGLARFWIVLSAPAISAFSLVQWSPALLAAALYPWAGLLLVAKPTLGLALFAYRPSWRAALGSAALVALAFVVLPRWPLDWMEAVRHTPHLHPPVVRAGGWIALLALRRWRTPEARLVAVMALVPQNLYFYDQLPLMLVARTGREALALTACGWIAMLAAYAGCTDPNWCGAHAEPWIVWLLYAPATLLVLLRPGPADLPPAREWSARLRAWIARPLAASRVAVEGSGASAP